MLKKGFTRLMNFCALAFLLTLTAGAYGFETPSESETRSSAAMMQMPMMQMPTGQMMFTFGAIVDPVIGTNPQTTMPIGVGTIAMGGNMLSVHAQVGQFQFPMDMYFA